MHVDTAEFTAIKAVVSRVDELETHTKDVTRAVTSIARVLDSLIGAPAGPAPVPRRRKRHLKLVR